MMKHASKEETYAKRIQESKVEREYLVKDALQRTHSQNKPSSKRSIPFKFTKNNLFK